MPREPPPAWAGCKGAAEPGEASHGGLRPEQGGQRQRCPRQCVWSCRLVGGLRVAPGGCLRPKGHLLGECALQRPLARAKCPPPRLPYTGLQISGKEDQADSEGSPDRHHHSESQKGLLVSRRGPGRSNGWVSQETGPSRWRPAWSSSRALLGPSRPAPPPGQWPFLLGPGGAVPSLASGSLSAVSLEQLRRATARLPWDRGGGGAVAAVPASQRRGARLTQSCRVSVRRAVPAWLLPPVDASAGPLGLACQEQLRKHWAPVQPLPLRRVEAGSGLGGPPARGPPRGLSPPAPRWRKCNCGWWPRGLLRGGL